METLNLLPKLSRIRSNFLFSRALTILFLATWMQMAKGQIYVGGLTGANLLNAPNVSVPFLTIAPDGRSAGLGDVGAASSPDVNSQHWNVAKYVFSEKRGGAAFTYTPWVTNMVRHINHYYLAGYYRIGEKNALSGSARLFTLGDLYFPGIGIQSVSMPFELSVDAGYSRKFTAHLSAGLVLRYIHSDLVDNQTSAGEPVLPGRSVAGDMGLYYQGGKQPGSKDARWALGLNISNIGSPVSYSEDADKIPIPTNMRLGGRYSFHLNEDHRVTLLADLNKLLVPTPGEYAMDSLSENLILIRGKEYPSSVIRGMLQSFYDAPGILRSDGSYSVLAEEVHEIAFSLGAEYSYRELFAVRSGYFHEHQTKGNRRYLTFGAGVRYRFLTFDLSYLFPAEGKDSPLFNTFRFSLSAEFGT
jgi:uncharacterized membrane protein YhdT